MESDQGSQHKDCLECSFDIHAESSWSSHGEAQQQRGQRSRWMLWTGNCLHLQHNYLKKAAWKFPVMIDH